MVLGGLDFLRFRVVGVWCLLISPLTPFREWILVDAAFQNCSVIQTKYKIEFKFPNFSSKEAHSRFDYGFFTPEVVLCCSRNSGAAFLHHM